MQVFGEQRLRCGNLTVTSTKGALGHLLGAAGAVEAAVTVLAAHGRRAPPTVNLVQPDDVQMTGLARTVIALPPGSGCLCNSFGFGGINASLLVAPCNEPP